MYDLVILLTKIITVFVFLRSTTASYRLFFYAKCKLLVDSDTVNSIVINRLTAH